MSQWPNYNTIPIWANNAAAVSFNAGSANTFGVYRTNAGYVNANTGEILVAIRQLTQKQDLESIPQISTRTLANGNYTTGNPMYINVVFSEPVEVVIPDAANNTPKIKMKFQTPAGAAGNVFAWYFDGSNSNTLVFRHVVAANAQTFFTQLTDYNPQIDANGGFIMDTAYVRGMANTNANVVYQTANLASVRVNP